MKLIDKDALIAEIKSRISNIEVSQKMGLIKKRDANKKIFLFRSVLSLVDTLEVKEVDLEKEIKEQSDKYYSQCEKKLQEMDDNDKDLSFLSLDNFAKYFFELGLKAQKGENNYYG